MLAPAELQTALSKVPVIPVHGPWSRAVAHCHLLGAPPGLSGPPQPLWGGASRIAGSRFTPQGSFDAVYLAEDSITALAEVQAMVFLAGTAVPLPLLSDPWTLVSVKGVASRVLDLTDAATLNALGTNEQEMTGRWWKAGHPPTQVLGQAAFDSGRITGIRYLSARNIAGVNLVVFPDRLPLTPTDYLEVHDSRGHLAQRIGA